MKYLFQLRTKSGMTQQELADKVGILQSQIQRYETGKTKPTTEVALRIANALNTTVEHLHEDENGDQWPREVSEAEITYDRNGKKEQVAFEQNILSLARMIKYEDREAILKLLTDCIEGNIVLH